MRAKLEAIACALTALLCAGWFAVHGLLHTLLHLLGLSCPF